MDARLNGKIDRIFPRAVVLLLMLALLFRFYAAAIYSVTDHPDIAINALMSRHIAEGRHFPVFFYGQAYMGTLEAYVGALFYRMMSHSLLPAMLGSALFSFLALPMLFLWARRLYGIRAALFAVALMVIGPTGLVYYNNFLGYPGMLFTGLTACWLTVRIIQQKNQPSRNLAVACFGLGLAAGLGWWINSLVVSFIFPCLLLLLINLSPRRLLRLSLPGLAGFAVGAFPWISYTLRHHDSLSFVSQVSTSPDAGFFTNLLVAFHQILRMYDVAGYGQHPFNAVMFTLLMALCLLSLFAHRGEEKTTPSTPEFTRGLWLMPWLIIATNLFLCTISTRFAHVPAHRYLIPVLPAISMLAATGATWLSLKTKRSFTGILLVSLIIGWHVYHYPNYWSEEHQTTRSEYHQNLQALLDFQLDHGIDAWIGDWFAHWLSFHSGEKLSVSCYPRFDRYRPYRAAVATATNLTVINNYHDVMGF